MADTKITALTALTAADPANDVIPIVDVSDTTMAASGTTKKISVNNILSSSPTASGALTVTGLVTAGSATITGDLTVDTSTLKVDSANNRVGIGTATPGAGYSLDILGAAVGGIRVSSNNYPNLVIDSANSNGALIYIQEGGTTQARIGHLTAVTGLEFSGNNGTAATNVHYAIDSTGISTWQNVGGVAGTAMTLNATGLGVGVVPAAGDGSGAFKAAGTGSLTANSRVGLDVRELVSGNQAGIILGAMTTENTAVIGSRTGSGNIAFQTYNGASWGERMRIDYLGNLILQSPATPATLTTNGQLTVNATSNTNLRFSYRGSDGVTRTADLTLA